MVSVGTFMSARAVQYVRLEVCSVTNSYLGADLIEPLTKS